MQDGRETTLQTMSSGSSENLNTQDLLKQALDYCSHAWPSDKIHESLLSNLSCSTRPEPDPADLSTLVFSDASDDERQDANSTVKGGSQSKVETRFQAAINPTLTSKHAKIAQMQRMLHRSMEKKYEGEGGEGGEGREGVNFLAQGDLGAADLTSDTSPRCSQTVTSLTNESKGALDSWSTSITRRHQREVSMKELKIQEWRFLRSNFGKVMKDLESFESNAKSSKEGQVGQVICENSQDEDLEDLDDLEGLPSVREMSQSECRRLLQQMKPLVHAPATLYRALAKRALDEYAKFKPLTFHDCRRITFWQFGNDKTKRERDRTDRTWSALHCTRFDDHAFQTKVHDLCKETTTESDSLVGFEMF